MLVFSGGLEVLSSKYRRVDLFSQVNREHDQSRVFVMLCSFLRQCRQTVIRDRQLRLEFSVLFADS